MAKKTFKAVLAFGILLGCYFGYLRAFAVVVEHFRLNRHVETTSFVVFDSKSKRQANELAKTEFGNDHWSADPDLPFRYYNSDRGFWMYAKKVWRIDEEDGVKYDGKRVRMAPFALIWKSRDGASTKTIISDEAVFDLNEPLGLNTNPGGQSLKVKHAWIQKNVMIRDNRGTSRDSSDDMNIGPLTAIEYDEPTQQIRSESDVVIQDREMRITGVGMKIQLRAKDPASVSAGNSAGFEGAETLYLYKNVHVAMKDVGKSGIMPGSVQTKRVSPAEIQVTAQTEKGRTPRTAGQTAPNEPTPLDVRSDSTMRVDMPKPQTAVAIGPPERPGPTLVQFDRNVVVLRGPLDSQRDQLNCDTLKLTLVPGEQPQQGAESPTKAARAAEVIPESDAETDAAAPRSTDKGLFGDLTLQRAHATGHAVWLYLPAQGTKLRCNELIHKRLTPPKPDETYLRGDLTRPLEIWKVDVVKDEGPDQGKVTSVTHIRTVDATMFDSGTGLDSANVIARGPGRMETRPDRDRPVERIAIWQKQLEVKNLLEPDGRVKQKIIVLSGNRPCFIDTVQKTSLDSGATIYVWLKPKPATPQEAGTSPSAPATDRSTGIPLVMASSGAPSASTKSSSPQSKIENNSSPNADLGGGNFQIERLLAHRDVHLTAPAKTMTARLRLDADFVDAEPTPVGATSTASASIADQQPTQATDQAGKPNTSPDQAVTQTPQEPQSTEPPMVGSAERVWALIAQNPASGPQSKKGANGTTSVETASTTAPSPLGSNADIRKVWMWGNVALHQDPGVGKKKGQDATGEAMYVDNRGKGKVFTRIYHRDPTDKTRQPGPVPPARIENDDVIILANSGYAGMDQALDQAWVEGPGSMTQLADRGFLTDKSPETTETDQAKGADKPGADAKPKTRAGRPLTEKTPMTIAFTQRMRFFGRTTDPEGRPAARGDFYGIVNARMEDALLHCEEQMHAFTDKEVPLAQLGAMSKPKADSRGAQAGDENVADNDKAEPEPQAQLALIYCYKNAWGISRKVDPDSPTLLEEQKIFGIESLTYDRRTGEFEIPGEGVVWLYNRDNDSSENPSSNPALPGSDDTNGGVKTSRTKNGRIVKPTSGRVSNAPGNPVAANSRTTARPTPTGAAAKPKADEIPPLILTQIQFKKGMTGRNGTGKENDKTAIRWSEFFGDIQVSRAQVPGDKAVLNPDRLPKDGFYLTGQTLRVITEPPPASAPPNTPARNYLKAWERAQVTSSDKIMEADVITYDSYKDLMYAYGEHGRKVYFADQHAPGQQASTGSGKAVQFNPKTGTSNVIDSESMMLLDKKTGIRPTEVGAPDPNAKAKKKTKKPYRTPPANIERRNFTGQ